MIYSVTLNPSIDYVMELPGLKQGSVNRASSTSISAGGKGINVSTVLSSLGVENRMLGFVAGFTGAQIEAEVSSKGYDYDFIKLDRGLSRINVKLCTGETTDVNAPGPEIPRKAFEELISKLSSAQEGDYVVLAGAIPESLPGYAYQEIMERFMGKGIRFVVDAEGSQLLAALGSKPFLIKPNRTELEKLFSVKILLQSDVDKYAAKLQEMGAENVMVSLDGEGGVLFTADGKKYYTPAPNGQVKNPVGAGDSMVAGVLYSLSRGESFEDALKMGVAAGSATAFQNGLALADDILALRGRL